MYFTITHALPLIPHIDQMTDLPDFLSLEEYLAIKFPSNIINPIIYKLDIIFNLNKLFSKFYWNENKNTRFQIKAGLIPVAK